MLGVVVAQTLSGQSLIKRISRRLEEGCCFWNKKITTYNIHTKKIGSESMNLNIFMFLITDRPEVIYESTRPEKIYENIGSLSEGVAATSTTAPATSGRTRADVAS